MQVNNGLEGSSLKEAQYFTGEVWMDQLAVSGEQTQLSIAPRAFLPGCPDQLAQAPPRADTARRRRSQPYPGAR